MRLCLSWVKSRLGRRPFSPSALPPIADIGRRCLDVRKVRILLQKSKVASVEIFGETLKRETVDDSDNLSRASEVAYEFCVRR
jgi:hypothetical protein